MRIFVGNLSLSTSDQDLVDAFAPYGAVASANVIRNLKADESKGFGFVEMGDVPEALSAISSLDDSLLNGRAILVSQAPRLG